MQPEIVRKPSIRRMNTTMTQLTILPFKKNMDIRADETVMQALRRGGYEIEGPCNGRGFAESAESGWKILPTCRKQIIAVFLRLRPGKGDSPGMPSDSRG
jgi:hypothetical protein